MTEKALRVVRVPTLVKVGKSYVSQIGYRAPLALEHLMKHEDGKWCTPECMGKAMWGRQTQGHSDSIRGIIPRLVRALLPERLLVVTYDRANHGRISAFKIYEGQWANEVQAALEQLERMKRNKQLTDAKIEMARKILGLEG